MMLMKFADLSQSKGSNWVMEQVKDPCPRPGGRLFHGTSRGVEQTNLGGTGVWPGKIGLIKSVKTWTILLYILLHL